MNCVFCAQRIPINFKQTNYGKACNTSCAMGGIVGEIVKCALKKAPCIGHPKKYCSALNDLLNGRVNPDLEALNVIIGVHASRCAGGCKMFHSLDEIVEHARPPPPPPMVRRMTVADAARVCVAYQTKYDPHFCDRLKRVMCQAGFPGLQHLLDKVDTFTVDGLSFHSADFSSQFVVADIGHMICLYRYEMVHLCDQRNFTMDMKGVMRAEGVPEMQALLDNYAV
jgi:hypothetical protein